MTEQTSGSSSSAQIAVENLDQLGLSQQARARVERVLRAAIENEVEAAPDLQLANADYRIIVGFSK